MRVVYKLQVELLRRNKAVKVERSEHAWKFQSTDLMTKTFPMYSITVLSYDTNPTHVQAHAHKLSVNVSYSLSGSTVYCLTILSNTKISHVSRSIRILSVNSGSSSIWAKSISHIYKLGTANSRQCAYSHALAFALYTVEIYYRRQL